MVSIRREDAERLGYTDVDSWRALVCSCLPEIAKGYKIPLTHLKWYAALHEKEKHVHIHMILFSTNPKEGYLTKQGIRNVKSAFAKRIFQQDLLCTYERKTEYRNELQASAEERMAELIHQMRSGEMHNEWIEQLTIELADRLNRTGARKQSVMDERKRLTVIDAHELMRSLMSLQRTSASRQPMRSGRKCRT